MAVEFMNKRLKTGIYIIGLSLISSGSAVSTQVVAKENNSDISLVEVKNIIQIKKLSILCLKVDLSLSLMLTIL